MYRKVDIQELEQQLAAAGIPRPKVTRMWLETPVVARQLDGVVVRQGVGYYEGVACVEGMLEFGFSGKIDLGLE